MHTVLQITSLLRLGGGWCRGVRIWEQSSNLLHNLLVPWGRRLTAREGPWCVVHSPAAGSWGLPRFLSCSLKFPEVGEMFPDPGVGLWGCPPQSLFPKIFVPRYFYESLGVWVGREELMDDNCIQIPLRFSDLLSPLLAFAVCLLQTL